MLHELVEDPESGDPAAFEEAYRSGVAGIVDRVGRDRVVESGVDSAVVDAVTDGDLSDLTVSAAAELLALESSAPDAEAIRQESLEHLLLGMTQAVVDVDTIAANLALDASPTGIQQRIEGRAEMSLSEYAHVHALIEDRKQ